MGDDKAMSSTVSSGGNSPQKQFKDMADSLFGAGGPFLSYLRNIAPQTLLEQNMAFYKNLFEISVGSSTIAADKKDARFQDEAWTSNPLYKRLSQAYLAMTDAVEKMIPEDLASDEKARAQLAVSVVTTALSPTNTLLGNPEAMTKTLESGGSNLARGFAAYV